MFPNIYNTIKLNKTADDMKTKTNNITVKSNRMCTKMHSFNFLRTSYACKARTLLLLASVLIAACNVNAAFYVNNISYVIGTNSEVKVVGYKSGVNLGNVSIPSTVQYEGKKCPVTEIDNNSLNGCQTITSITIPASVTIIREGAFNGCGNLTKVEIAEGGLKKIGSWAFAKTAITKFTIPASVTEVMNDVFNGCTKLANLQLGVGLSKIPTNMCKGCTSLTSINIPQNITYLGDNSFQNCNLSVVEIPSGITYFGWAVFKGNNNISKVRTHIEEPNNINSDNFEQTVYNNATLYVPTGTQEIYQNKDGWKKFYNMQEIDDETSIYQIKINSNKMKKTYSVDGTTLPASQRGLKILTTSDGVTHKYITK